MAHATVHYDTRSHTLFFAIAISLAMHTLALVTLPAFQFNSEKVPTVLEIELQPPQPKPEPPPPEVSKPEEPPKPEPKPQPKRPVPQNNPKPAVEPRPAPAQNPEPVAPPPRVDTPPQPAVIAATPKADEHSAFVAPAAEPSLAPTQDINADIGNYGTLLALEFAKHKKYPRIAQLRGWTGKPKLEIRIDANGKIASISISKPSDHEVLDKATLETARKVSELSLPPIPESLRGKEFTIIVPFDFKLE